jgi:hypothetical protein
MKTRTSATAAILSAIVALAAAAHLSASSSTHDASAAGALTVTVKYTGKGPVDQSHQLWVWLFDNPNIGPGAIPIAELSIAKNGGQAAFTAVAADKVFIAVAYDIAGGFAGQAPPPSGSPVIVHSDKAGAPLAVATGDKARVAVTFDDTQKMP